ncbi:MAG: ABC transporter ATP-binding protein [Lentisphaeria bacterium]|nr:ABC transporter ATP-binding protein [Lentisphaeria bacterium]
MRFSNDLVKKPLTFRYVRDVLRNFVHYYRPHLRLFWLSIFCALANAGLTTLVPLLVYAAFNKYLPAKDFTMLTWLIGGMLILMFLISLTMYINVRYGHVLGVRMEADMRRDLFSHLQKLSFSFFDKSKTGHLMSRITNDLTMISELAHHGPEDIVSSILLFCGGVAVMLYINPLLTLITMLPFPLVIFWAGLFQGRMRSGFRDARKEVAEINSQVENSLQGIREVKSFTNERREIGKFRHVNSRYRHIREKIFFTLGLFHSGIHFFIHGYSLLFIGAGIILVYYNRATVVDVMTFFMYSKYITMPVFRLVEFAEQFHMGLTAYERFYEILQIAPEVAEKTDPLSGNDPLKGEIELDHIHFSYNDDEEVLKDLSLHIDAGKTIALVGESGAGKTTLAALLPRFYDVCSGVIRIDGQDVRDYSLRYLRQNIGVVQQTPFLFDSTIRENILFGKMNATEEELIVAAKEANIYDFIRTLPDGFDTLTGEHGVRLSGGQKQRIAIARVFLKNPPILIFDEATSALDNQSEALVQQSMEKLCKGRTTIIIAHRLSTVKNADYIYCLRGGELVEHGSHADLLAVNGYYKTLYEMHSF